MGKALYNHKRSKVRVFRRKKNREQQNPINVFYKLKFKGKETTRLN